MILVTGSATHVSLRVGSNQPTVVLTLSSSYYPAANTRMLPRHITLQEGLFGMFLCLEKGFTPAYILDLNSSLSSPYALP